MKKTLISAAALYFFALMPASAEVACTLPTAPAIPVTLSSPVDAEATQAAVLAYYGELKDYNGCLGTAKASYGDQLPDDVAADLTARTEQSDTDHRATAEAWNAAFLKFQNGG